MELNSIDIPNKKYKPFKETYSLCAFTLCMAFLYPNRVNKMKRFLAFMFVVMLNGGQIFWFATYTLKCLYTLDILNTSRNMALVVVTIIFFTKTFHVMHATDEFAKILEKISQDLLEANNLDYDYQIIYDEYIKQCKIGEISWLLIPTILSAQFPVYAGIGMTIESIQTDNFTRVMVHDMKMVFVHEIQSDTPFFECMFAYNCLQCIVMVPNFCGFDGSFCIATTHLCLKLKLMVNKIRRAFRNSNSCFELRRMLIDIIRDHQDALDFHEQIQKVYGPWLFTVFLLSSFMISFNLYQICILRRMELRSTLFAFVGVLHIYLPCHYASTLTKVSEDTAIDLYSVPWETWADPDVTKTLMFIINRAQRPLIVTGSGLILFNMDLFKSILQTSYSFCTLLTV